MTRENCAARCDAGMMAPMSFMSRFRLAWRTATAGDDAMPDGVRPPSRAAAADPLRISTVFRGVQVLQTAITGLPIDVYVDGVRTARQPAIIRQPDTRRSRRDVISDLVASMCLDGNAFLRVRRFGDEAVSCEVLPPHLVTVSMANDDIAAPDLRYSYDGHSYSARDVIHLKFLNVPGSLRGLGPISAAREEVEGAAMARDYKARFYTDASNIKGYLKSDQRMTEELAKGAKKAWKADGDALDIKVLGSNLSYVPLELKPADLQFLETQKFDTTQIARLLGIPASIMLAAVDGSNLTYSNIEQAWLEFADYTLAAYTGEIEEALTALLPAGQSVRFDWDSTRRADMSSRYAAYRTAIDAGWLTIDEVREREGYEPLKEQAHERP